MKRILLLRHAKSSWDDDSLADFDRPLAKRGRKDAPRMGAFAASIRYAPERVISSPAARAKETAERFAEAAGIEHDAITWNERLYHGGWPDYLAALAALPDEVKIAMVVGHNPKMEQLASAMCGAQRADAFRIPTAALLCFEHGADTWREVKAGEAQLKWMMIPKVVKKL